MSQRTGSMSLAMAVTLFLCGCGGGYDGPVGACVVDGLRSCTDDVSVDSCQSSYHGDHWYEGRRCSDVGYPK